MKMDKAKKILYETLIGVNKERIESHHEFLPSVLRAMEKYAEFRVREENT